MSELTYSQVLPGHVLVVFGVSGLSFVVRIWLHASQISDYQLLLPAMKKPFSQACENNKDPILAVLKRVLNDKCEVLEIGSGTGQHAVYFAGHLPQITWQPTDQTIYLPGISMWIEEAKRDNIKMPVPLDINDDPWPFTDVEAVFTANTLHIMSWEEVEIFYDRLGRYLKPGAGFLSYGPFNINGTYTSESNARFDCWLKEQDPKSAIRDMGALESLGKKAGITLLEKVPMPANNFTLIWKKLIR